MLWITSEIGICLAPLQWVWMTNLGNESETTTKYLFKGWYGAKPSMAPVREPTHEEVSDFVREILGLAKGKIRR